MSPTDVHCAAAYVAPPCTHASSRHATRWRIDGRDRRCVIGGVSTRVAAKESRFSERRDTLRPRFMLRVALIGYGYAGRTFHAPLIRATPGLELAVVCSRRAEAV